MYIALHIAIYYFRYIECIQKIACNFCISAIVFQIITLLAG